MNRRSFLSALGLLPTLPLVALLPPVRQIGPSAQMYAEDVRKAAKAAKSISINLGKNGLFTAEQVRGLISQINDVVAGAHLKT